MVLPGGPWRWSISPTWPTASWPGSARACDNAAKVAAALVHEPEIVILDEPLNGTDPVQRAHLTRIFVEMGRQGRTVIVSSHVLHEVERMADRVIAMVDGRLAASGTVPALRAAMTRRATVIGLIYLFLWESSFANAVGALAPTSLGHIALQAYTDLAPGMDFADSLGTLEPDAGKALIKVLVVALVSLVFTTWALRKRDLA